MDNNKGVKLIFVKNHQIGTRNTLHRQSCAWAQHWLKKNNSEYKKCASHRLESPLVVAVFTLPGLARGPCDHQKWLLGLQRVWEGNRERNEDVGRADRQLKAAHCTDRQPPQLLPGNNTCRGWSCAFAEELSHFIWIDVICSSEEEWNSLFTRESTEGYCPHSLHCTTAYEYKAGLESGGNILSHPKH